MKFTDRLMTRVLGCWHRRMGNPVTRNGLTYRTCMTCGAQRQFDTSRWKMEGPYYFSMASVQSLVIAEVSSVKRLTN